MSRLRSLLNLMCKNGGHQGAAETKKPNLEEEQAGDPSCKQAETERLLESSPTEMRTEGHLADACTGGSLHYEVQ